MSFLLSLMKSLWSKDDSAASPAPGPNDDRVFEDKHRVNEIDQMATDDERFAQEAAEVKVQWDREQHAIEQAHNDDIQAIQERLQKARQLVDKSGIGLAVCDILRIVWHWPSWSKRDDWKLPVPVEGLDGGKTPSHEHDEQQGTWIGWTWKGEPCQLELTVGSNYTGEDSTSGELRLWVIDELVMHLDVSQRLGDEYDRWHAFGVSELRPGPWMARVNELAGRLRIADRQKLREHEKNFYGEKAQKIELD